MVRDFDLTGGERLPPQNLEAEEEILGGILLDPEAIGRIAEVLQPETFYITAHQEIFRAAFLLHTAGRPTDLTSVAAWLDDNGKLEKVGGVTALRRLVEETVSSINIDQYARLVHEKFLRRRLIRTTQEIAQLAYDSTLPIAQVMDQSEQLIFDITQIRSQRALVPISDVLLNTFTDLEQKYEGGDQMPGVPTDFYDLDNLTQGLQRSDLIIVAGRPSMGKCLVGDSEIVLTDGRITTLSAILEARQADLLTLGDDGRFHPTEPSAFINDGIKPVVRVITRSGRTLETTLSHPYLTPSGWVPLANLSVGDRIAVPQRIPVFGTIPWPEHQIKLLAYLLSRHSARKPDPGFGHGDPSIVDDFLQSARCWVGIDIVRQTDRIDMPYYLIQSEGESVEQHRSIFAQRLSRRLAETQQTTEGLTEQLGLPRARIRQWLNGGAIPTPEILKRLCQVLRLTPEELLPEGTEFLKRKGKTPLLFWLERLRLSGQKAQHYSIPSEVFTFPQPQVALFLNRLFSPDAEVNLARLDAPQISYTTLSERMVRQVQHLLLRFGILSLIKFHPSHTRRQTAYWQLDILDTASIETFISEIGLLGQKGALFPILQLSFRQKGPVGVFDLMPAAAMPVTEEVPGTPAAAIVATTTQICWDRIVSITPTGSKQVYDLTIPETHNFVANDICVHNTAFSLTMAHNVAAKSQQPVAVFSLEMSREQLVQRLLASESRIESGRLRSGRIPENQWPRLSQAIGSLAQLPIFIDDTANATVTEIRSKARRLQAEQGQSLGMILLDYLQLMEGSGDNRVQELSRITRGLKALAKELSVPVVVLSQLSRAVESRSDKRPQLSDLRESGCLSGDTLLTDADSGKVWTLTQLASLPNPKLLPRLLSLNSRGRLIPQKPVRVFSSGEKPICQLKTRLNYAIQATGSHPFLTRSGWKPLDDLQLDEPIAIALQHEEMFWDPVTHISEPIDVQPVYDIEMPRHHNFVANGIVVHNSIEQDADIVMMLYRPEYYDPNTSEKGIAEVIIAKHRNGPTGIVKLLFESQFIRFVNLADPNR